MIFAILIGLLTAVLLYFVMFKDWDEFVECVEFYCTPDHYQRAAGAVLG